MTPQNEIEEAAIQYVKETDYIDNLNRNLAGNAFLAGAKFEREHMQLELSNYKSAVEVMASALKEIYEEPNKTGLVKESLFAIKAWGLAAKALLSDAVRKVLK